MVNLVQMTPTPRGSYLSNRITVPTTVSNSMNNDADVQKRAEDAANSVFETTYKETPGENFATRMLQFGAASGIDVVDTLGSILPGVERGDVWEGAAELGMEGLADWQAKNKSGVEIGSAVLLSIGTGYMMEKYAFGALANGLTKNAGLSSSALTRLSTMVPRARATALSVQESGALAGNLAQVANPATQSAIRNFYLANAAHHGGKALATESTIVALGHNNEAIWSEDMSNNMFWFGLGVLLPAGVGSLQARAEMRAAANSSTTMEMRRQALDPNDYIKHRDAIADPTLPYNPDQKLKQSAIVTTLAFEARQKIPTNATPELKTALSQQNLQSEIALQSELKKMAQIPIEQSTFQKVQFDDNSPHRTRQRAHILDAIESDPSAMEEVVAFGTTTNLAAGLKARDNNINKLLSSVLPEEVAEGRRLNKQQPYILIENRWYDARNKEAVEFAEYDPRKVKITKTLSTGGQEWQVQLQGGHTFRINPTARLLGKSFSERSIQDRLGITQSFKDLSSRMRQGKPQQQIKYVVGDSDDWLQNEFALYHASKNGQVDFTRSKMKTLDEVRFAAVKGKIAAMKKDGVWKTNALSDNWARKKYNLPEASQVERIHDGSSKAIHTVLSAVDSGQITSYAEAKRLYNDLLTRHEMIATTRVTDREFSGDMWTFNENSKGEWYDPVIAMHEPDVKNPTKRGTRAQVAEELAINKQVVYHTLADNGTLMVQGNPKPPSVVQRVNELVHKTPEGQYLTKIGGGADEQVTGRGQGLGAEAGAVLTQTQMGRDNLMMPAAVKTNQMAQDIAMDVTKAEHLALQKEALPLTSSINKKSRQLYNHFATARPGWDLKAGAAFKGSDGLWRFELDETAHNASRLGRKVNKGEVLQSHVTGQDLVLDDLGMNFFRKFNTMLESKRIDENRIRAALGLGEIRHTPYYLPSEDTKGKFIAFVIDGKTGKVIPGKSIIADSADDFAMQRQKAYRSLGADEYLHTQHEISFTQDLYDQSQQAWVNSKFVGRRNASATGALAGEKIRQNTVEEHLKYLQDKNVHLANATLRTVLADQIQIAKMRRVMARIQYGLSPEVANKAIETGPRTIWDDFLQNVAGPEIAQVPKRAVTKMLDSFEGVAQKGLNATWVGMRNLSESQVGNMVRDVFTRFGAPMKGTAKDFSELTQQLGPHMPYRTLDEYVEQIDRAGKPPEVREIASKMNRWDASWRLRYLEIPNAAMNMLGIIANMPAIAASSRMPVIGQLVNSSGKKVGVVDTVKLLMEGTTESFKKTWTRDWDYADKHGGLEQGVAEIRRVMSTIELTKGNPSESRLAWRKAFMGDKSLSKNSKMFSKDWIRYHGIDGLLSRANDTTEAWSRTWAHGIGLKLADLHGITGEAERFNFANSIADQAIANYSPLNRGEIFQSAFGSLFGLYQTYAMNYTGRMFRYLEQGNYSALMRQASMQSAMFGVGSNIGWNQLEWLEDKATDDEATISDMVYAKFGPIVGSALSHGGVAEFAEFLGAPSGIALYTRADTNVRFNMLPTDSSGAFDFTKMSAAIGTANQLGQGMFQILQTLWNDDSIVTGQRISEIAANMVPNRLMKGVITVGLNDGYETDRYGAVTAINQGVFESAVRMLGLRTTRQQDEIDQYYANRGSLDKQAARMEQLREETRGLVRSGGIESKLADVFQTYVDRGGDPSNFKSWYRQILESATTTRGLREDQKALNSQKMQAMHARYGFVD